MGLSHVLMQAQGMQGDPGRGHAADHPEARAESLGTCCTAQDRVSQHRFRNVRDQPCPHRFSAPTLGPTCDLMKVPVSHWWLGAAWGMGSALGWGRCPGTSQGTGPAGVEGRWWWVRGT